MNMALQHSESGRSEQIVSQFLLKSLHVILESRVPSLRPCDPSGEQTPCSRARKSDKWFNLALGGRPSALKNLSLWHPNVMDPMIIDVVLVRDADDPSKPAETVLERWTIHYESHKNPPPMIDASVFHSKTYKKSILLLRSLYAILRILPAFRVYKRLISTTQAYPFDISYKVSSFGEPFSRATEDEMNTYAFAPVDTPSGRLSVSVTYRPSLSDLNLETPVPFPPQIITDYVGSPAADPLRAFPSDDKLFHRTSFPVSGFHSPSSAPLQRPHSWTSGLHGVAHLPLHRMGESPPTYAVQPNRMDFQPSPPDLYYHRSPTYRPSIHKKGTSFDECRLSPPFSTSPSMSPPAYLSGAKPTSQNRMRSGSAPVFIPHPGRSLRQSNPNSSDPSRHSLPPPSPRSTRVDASSQESLSDGRYFRKLEATRSGELASPKVFKDGKDDSGRFSGVVSSSGSPRIGFSRSSSRLSFQDDLDDSGFSCPFVDDVDTLDSQRTHYGKESSESTPTFPSARQSPDAAVGLLVQMLRTAPPLRQDQSFSAQTCTSDFNGEVSAGFLSRRKTADALEELRSYREMKALLLSQSGTQLVESIKQTE